MSDNGHKSSGIRLRKQVPSRDQLSLHDGVTISVTQAYCHKGHPLIQEGNHTFQDQPGIKVLVSQGDGEAHELTLSPIHGNHDRHGHSDFAYGQRCSVTCPECKDELKSHEQDCSCGRGRMRLFYLTKGLETGDVAMVCDAWGCQRSRVLDKFELLSEWVDEE